MSLTELSLTEVVKQAIDAVVRPPRREYDLYSLPTIIKASDGNEYCRHAVSFTNRRGQKIVGSIYADAKYNALYELPCVIYMHGNASCQIEGQFLIPNVCPRGLALFLFDFAGCGCSQGEYISLGHFEGRDLQFLLNMLEATFAMNSFALWGRSMGAATALMINDPRIKCRITDAAYATIKGVCKAIALSMGVPSWMCGTAIWLLGLAVDDKADFDLTKVRPVDVVKSEKNNIPIIIGHAKDDEFVPFKHSVRIFKAYNCPDKTFVELENGHNGTRGKKWHEQCYRFIFEKLGVDSTNVKVKRITGFEKVSAHFANASMMMLNQRDGEDEETHAFDSVMHVYEETSDFC